MGSLARWLVPFALLAFAAAAPAQQRKPCFVTVVDADDQPLAHAEVTLVEVGHLGIDAPDVVRAFTDVRGRARPEVVVGRLYSASAMADAAADGSRLVSEPTDRGACGIVLDLVAMYRAAPRPLRLVDSEATKEHWSRGLHVLGPDGQSTLVLPVDAEGVATLPPSPWAPLPLGMRDANGALLQAVSVDATVATPTVSFPKPTMLPLEITGADGKPAVGATASVLRWTMFTDSLLGEVGTVLCPVMARADASGARVIADLAGRAEILLGDGDWGIYMVDGRNHAWLFVDRDRTSGELDVKLDPIPVLTMRVLDGEGKPVRGARVERQPNSWGDIGTGEAVRAKMARDAIVGECADGLAMQAQSNRAGQLAVPVQDWVPWQMTFRARAGERVSAPFPIKPGVDLGDVVVQ